jgi:hypothetical protein
MNASNDVGLVCELRVSESLLLIGKTKYEFQISLARRLCFVNDPLQSISSTIKMITEDLD